MAFPKMIDAHMHQTNTVGKIRFILCLYQFHREYFRWIDTPIRRKTMRSHVRLMLPKMAECPDKGA